MKRGWKLNEKRTKGIHNWENFMDIKTGIQMHKRHMTALTKNRNIGRRLRIM